jgi:hypothetical protein
VDKTLRSVCQVSGYELEAKFRTNHSFVVYRSADEETGAVKEVLDGTWILKDGKTGSPPTSSPQGALIELFGRSHRNEMSFDPYADPDGKETTSITGGALKVTRVGDLKKADYDALVTKFTTGPLKWSFDCDKVKKFDALAAAGAYVVEGRAVTAILTP